MNYKKENLLFLPLGGSGEIGMNMNHILKKNNNRLSLKNNYLNLV